MIRLAAILCLLLICETAFAQHSHVRIFATAIANDSAGAFMGGSSNGSGLYQSDDTGRTWRHLGWNNIKAYSMDEVQSSNGRILYLATGLGILRSTDFGEKWKVLTDWRIAEAMDVAVNQKHPNEIYIATAHGPWRSRDGGVTWQQLLSGLSVPYCSKVVIDSVLPNQVSLAAEDGLFKLVDDSIWKPITSRSARSDRNAPSTETKKVRAIVQSAAHYWQVADGQHWCTAEMVSTSQSDKRPSYWSYRLVGGADGIILHSFVGDSPVVGKIDSIRNVSACLLIADTPGNVTAIYGALGNGIRIIRRLAKWADQIVAVGNPESRRELPIEQHLAGREIWTLKSFIVQK